MPRRGTGGDGLNVFVDIEQSGIGTWIRESPSILSYPTILFLHTVGLGLLVGTSVAIDLRILGAGRESALGGMDKFFPLLWLGFWISAASGVALWVADAHTWSKDVVFYIKMGFIVLSMLSVRLIRNRVLRNPSAREGELPPEGKMLAIASLVFWVGAITAGRLTAYIGK